MKERGEISRAVFSAIQQRAAGFGKGESILMEGNGMPSRGPETVAFNGQTYTLDAYGFLNPPDQWDVNFANGMAEALEIYGGLTERHWELIRYVRRQFLEEKTIPVSVIACAENNIRLREFRHLFPPGYHRGVCRIAGINYEFMVRTNIWLTYETPPSIKADYKVTPLGFLEHFDDWDERFVNLVIREWHQTQGLTERQRVVIGFLRDFYQKNRDIPTIYETCKGNDLSLEAFNELFPKGYRRGACLIAGLPFSPKISRE